LCRPQNTGQAIATNISSSADILRNCISGLSDVVA